MPTESRPATGWSVSEQGRTRLDQLDRWWSGLAGDAAADGVSALLDAASSGGLLDLPLPGSGATRDRWAALAWWGSCNLSMARLVEGHADAIAILAELGAPPLPPGVTSAVWAAERPDSPLRARQRSNGTWQLQGTKHWCSGAGLVRTALVTATADDGSRLFCVDMAASGVRPGPASWRTTGMAASDTRSVSFEGAAGRAIGGPGSYLDRPGFWFGGMGVAAVWWGGATAAAAPLRAAARAGRAGPHALAHLGWIRTGLTAAAALLGQAADVVDHRPAEQPEALMIAVRSAVAEVADEVLDRVGRALGPGPMVEDPEHSQRLADLGVFLRQHHAERDLARLGELDDPFGALACR